MAKLTFGRGSDVPGTGGSGPGVSGNGAGSGGGGAGVGGDGVGLGGKKRLFTLVTPFISFNADLLLQ